MLIYSIIFTVYAAMYGLPFLTKMNNHDKFYESEADEQLRFNNFRANLRVIEEHNARYEEGKETFYLGTTKFADMSPVEFRQKFLHNQVRQPKLKEIFKPPLNLSIPYSFDWRNHSAVLDIKNLGNCHGGYWAFSATGALEGQYAIKYGKKLSLSEQNLLDCSRDYGNEGCDGGNKLNAYEYVMDMGIESEDDYPYAISNTTQTCKYDFSKRKLKVKKQIQVDDYEYALLTAIATIGPISVSLYADYDFVHLYKGGILKSSECGISYVNFAALVVGYGTQNNVNYWIIKNSWGPHWGEKGYIRLIRDSNHQCGIYLEATYPVLA